MNKTINVTLTGFETLSGLSKTINVIIATINAEKEERLILGAHYDVHGDQAGADDQNLPKPIISQ